jgi:hypothetical protein
MRGFLLSLGSGVLLPVILPAAVAPEKPAEKPPTTAEARTFLQEAEAKLLALSVDESRAGWPVPGSGPGVRLRAAGRSARAELTPKRASGHPRGRAAGRACPKMKLHEST